MTDLLILDVLLVLGLAVIVGEVFEQLRLPSVAGELLAGFVLGPSIFGLVTTDSQIQAISFLALFFIIFSIGLETRTETLRENLSGGIRLTITSFIAPMLAVMTVAQLIFHQSIVSNFLMAVAIAVPSISIISVFIFKLGLSQQRSGELIISSVVIAEITAFVFVALVTQSIIGSIQTIDYLVLFIATILFFDLIIKSRIKFFRGLVLRSSKIIKRPEFSYAILIVFGLFLSLVMENIGIDFILGTFFAGLIVHEELIGREMSEKISQTFRSINRGFFIPLFFGFAGAEARLSFMNSSLFLVLIAFVAIAILSSIPLSYLILKYTKFKDGEKSIRQIAVILGGRGAIGVTIITVALSDHLVNPTTYSLVILATIMISITVSLFLRER